MPRSRAIDPIFEPFSFLWQDLGFALESSRKHSAASMLAVTKDPVGVTLEYDAREALILVTVYRLVEGKIANNTMHAIMAVESINGFELNWILKLKHCGEPILPAYRYEYDRDLSEPVARIKRYAEFVAGKLRECAGEILAGDFTLFPELDRLVKQNYASYYDPNQ